jgi:tetratricopeptide (TPR) repeat protein
MEMGGILGAIRKAGGAVRGMHAGLLSSFRRGSTQRILARPFAMAVLLALAAILAVPGTGPAEAAELRGYDIIVANGLTEERVRVLLEARREGSEVGRRMAADLAARLGVEEKALAAFLGVVEERGVGDGVLLLGFAEVAARHAALLAGLAAPHEAADPAVVALVAEARAELAVGGYGRADELLADAEEAAWREAGEAGGHSPAAAARHAERGELSLLQLDPLQAAKHFGAASALVPPDARIERAGYLGRLAKALGRHGGDEGDAGTLGRVLTTLQDVLAEVSHDEAPLQWAMVQNQLGRVLTLLGEVKDDPALLEQAVLAHRAALEERVPLERSFIQQDLAFALMLSGEKGQGTEALKEAVAIYRAALKGLNRERMPIDWASVRHDMGVALAALGERKEDPALMQEAITAFRSAMEEFTRERLPFIWGMGQHNIGRTLGKLAIMERNPALLAQAAEAFRAALEERTRERKPFDWAETQSGLAFMLYGLGELNGDPAFLEQAAEAYRAAMEVQTREADPQAWALLQTSLGGVLMSLAEAEAGAARLEQAVEAFQSALAVFETGRDGHYAAIVARELDGAQTALDKRRADPDPPLPR